MKMIGKDKHGKQCVRVIPPCMEAAYLLAGWVEAPKHVDERKPVMAVGGAPGAKYDAGGGPVSPGENSAPATDKPASADEKPAPAKPAKTAKERAEARASEAGE